jgi:hypothetical protein
MQKRIALGLICVSLFNCFAPAAFAISPVTHSKKAQRVLAVIAQLGTGEQTRVAVRLRSGARLAGYVSAANGESFTVSDLYTGLQRNVKYSDVTQMHAQNLTSGQKYAIGTAILLAILFAIAYGAGHSD